MQQRRICAGECFIPAEAAEGDDENEEEEDSASGCSNKDGQLQFSATVPCT